LLEMNDTKTGAGGRGTLYPLLFSPFTIRDVALPNRIVFQPHFTALGSREGMPTDAHIAYHEERACGGTGLIIFESQAVHPSGKMSRRFVNAWDPAVVPMYERLTAAVHVHGTRIFGQLTHGGHTSLENPPHLLWAPTQMPEPSSHISTKAMDQRDIDATVRGFAVSARNALEGGFDGVEIKVGHDGLLRSFASPFFNRRSDRYGGSFENRLRLTLEVLEAVKAATRPDFPVGVRLCLDEYTDFGYGLDYGLQIARRLEVSGYVDYFNSDAGSFSSYWMEIPPAGVPDGAFQHLNAALKHESHLPVVAFGRIRPASLAEHMLAEGEADLIGWARQLIADPDTPNKLRAGREEDVRSCIACNDACIYQVGQEKAVRCVHNPGAGQERTWSEHALTPAPIPRRIVVVGGGPAGLKVAEVAARRGHAVIVLEREQQLGGLIRLAARQPKHELVGEVTRYLEHMVRTLGVDIRCGVTATVESIAELEPEVVVIATGSESNLPSPDGESSRAYALGRQVLPVLPGLDLPHVLSVDRVLSGEPLTGGRTLVIDGTGHWEAVGTAEYLADSGCHVTVVSSGPVIGSDLEGGTRTLFNRRAALKDIDLRPNMQVLEIATGRVRVAHTYSGTAEDQRDQYIVAHGAEEWIEDIDWVIPAIGRRSREDLYLACAEADALAGTCVERVGDCVAPRLIQSVILEAYALARDL